METLEGHGKYGVECEKILMETDAEAVLLNVIGGEKGHGFSVASRDHRIVLLMPKLLREMANEIEKQITNAAQQ